MPRIIVKGVVSKGKEESYILYEQGHFDNPEFILNKEQVKALSQSIHLAMMDTDAIVNRRKWADK